MYWSFNFHKKANLTISKAYEVSCKRLKQHLYMVLFIYLFFTFALKTRVGKCGRGLWITQKQSKLPHLWRHFEQCLDVSLMLRENLRSRNLSPRSLLPKPDVLKVSMPFACTIRFIFCCAIFLFQRCTVKYKVNFWLTGIQVFTHKS